MDISLASLQNRSILESLGADVPAPIPLDYGTDDINTVAPHETSTEGRALELLGSGVQAEAVASALGVTPGRIAQLLSDQVFAGKVAELRYENLQKHNARDGAYDSLEDTLIIKLKRSLPLMVRPDTILKAIQVVNGAKRRGQSAPDQTTNQNNIVNILLPTVVVQKFTTNVNNEVIRVGGKALQTMVSGNLLKQVEEAEEARVIEHETAGAEGTSQPKLQALSDNNPAQEKEQSGDQLQSERE